MRSLPEKCGSDLEDNNGYCSRTVWQDTGKCVWHAPVGTKSTSDLQNADCQTPIDGAELSGLNFSDDLLANRSLIDSNLEGANLEGANLEEANLEGANLEEANLEGANLEGANLEEANLEGANLEGANLTGAELINANLCRVAADNAHFCYANLSEAKCKNGASFQDADFTGTEIKNAEFNGVRDRMYPPDFSGAQFKRATICHVTCRCAIFSATTFKLAKLHNIKFTDANLTEADFQEARGTTGRTLEKIEYDGATVKKTKFNQVELSDTCTARKLTGAEASFVGANVKSVNFSESDLPAADFEKASVNGASFSDTNLSEASFSGIKLDSVSFKCAVLADADFTYADLSNADLRQADARNADFSDAVLTEAILEDANLSQADIRGANLQEAKLYQSELADVEINVGTEFDGPRTEGIYEKEPVATDFQQDIHPLKAAEWTYRRLEDIHTRNAMIEEASKYHVRKQEMQRQWYSEKNQISRWLISTINLIVTRHGESVLHVTLSSIGIILVSGVLFAAGGGIQDSEGNVYAIQSIAELTQWTGLSELLYNIYFSIITFSTIGYGDFHPHGIISKVLVGIESLAGALMLALFVYVLGRQIAR